MYFSNVRRGLRTGLIAVCVTIVALAAGFAPAKADAGHDEPHAAVAGIASPRLALSSDRYQFVGVVQRDALIIYVDRFDTNEPVASAVVEVSVNGQAFVASAQADGTYEVVSPLFKRAGALDIVATIVDGGSSDLLAGALTIPVQTGRQDRAAQTWVEHLAASLRLADGVGSNVVLAFGALIAGAFLGGAMVRNRRVGTALLAVAIVTVVSGAALAHEGHDDNVGATADSNAPQRLPDGTIFLPKPSQRLLDIRTAVLVRSQVAPTSKFNGRIIPNPNRSGVVQGTIAGRYVAPGDGVPVLGTPVKAGQPLGRVVPSFASIDSSQLSQTLAELEQQIGLNRQRLARQEQMLKSSAIAMVTVEETRFTLAGQIARRDEILSSRIREEELVAPVDGVIAAIRVASGQVLGPADRLFDIVDPSRPLVEAFIFDYAAIDRLTDAEMSLGDGSVVRLKYLGRSRALQQQYVVAQFEVVDPPGTLSVGLPVSISAKSGVAVEGLVLPRAALAQAPNGQTVVFQHTEPEKFVPRPIRFEPLDSVSVRILAGVKAGDRIVVRNAPLLNQIR